MRARWPRLKNRERILLGVLALTVLSLGAIVARDLREAAGHASALYDRLSRSVRMLDELQFRTQEVRRILLYPLHTSNANLQLQYAEQSRAGDSHVEALFGEAARAIGGAEGHRRVEAVRRAWREYLLIRDEVIGLILEGSLAEAVSLDEQEGAERFSTVRAGLDSLRRSFDTEAAVQVAAARSRTTRATVRLTALVLSALIASAVGISLVSRRSALEALLRIEAHKGSILEAVPDPVLSADAAGRIIELNEAAERTFGLTRADALGQRLEDAILPRARRGALWPMMSHARSEPRVLWPRLETVGRRPDGTEFPMELATVTHTAGHERVWTVHVSDLTERRKVEEQLRRAKDAAEEADRAKSEFLATMTHELRTPLVGVIGITDLLQKTSSSPPQKELIAMLRSSATALLAIVSDILDYSRIEAGVVELTPAPFTLRDCLEDALDSVTEVAARKGLDLGCVLDADVPARVVADRERVRQVLLNLLSNAVKFTESGQVALRVAAQRVEDRTVDVVLRVIDTGRGIPAHLQGRLFQRFSRIAQGAGRDPGTGLGLAIAQRLSRILGGSLTVESEPGLGSTFTFVFRAAIDPDAVVAAADRQPLSGLRVLTALRPGIAAEDIRSLLRGWGATVDEWFEARASEPAGVQPWDAFIIEEDPAREPSDAAREPSSHPTTEPVILVRRFSGTAETGAASGEPFVRLPVKAHALYEALSSRIRSGAAIAPPRAGTTESRSRDSALAILLVEDNDANRRVVDLMLRELGYAADLAASGEDAVEAACRRRYDVILMDLQMPDMDGLEATRRIRARTGSGDVRILALTANVQEGEETRCRAAGMDGYLSKPVRLQALAAALAQPPPPSQSVH